MSKSESVFAVVYENPNEFDYSNDDIRREVFGVYVTCEEAEKVLAELKEDNDEAEFYSIEEWDDDFII